MHKRLRYKNKLLDVSVYFYGNRMTFLNINVPSHLEIDESETKKVSFSYGINGESSFYFVNFQQI